jgi:hypothetical protein
MDAQAAPFYRELKTSPPAKWEKVASFPAMYQRNFTPEPPLRYFLDSFMAKFAELLSLV